MVSIMFSSLGQANQKNLLGKLTVFQVAAVAIKVIGKMRRDIYTEKQSTIGPLHFCKEYRNLQNVFGCFGNPLTTCKRNVLLVYKRQVFSSTCTTKLFRNDCVLNEKKPPSKALKFVIARLVSRMPCNTIQYNTIQYNPIQAELSEEPVAVGWLSNSG